jgi:poly-gamma-glutamate synthesis protein (capsule biosynthesis protein)
MTRRLIAVASLLAVCAAAPAFAQGDPRSGPRPPSDPAEFLRDPPRPASVKGRFSVVAVGDVMLARPQASTPDPEFQKVLTLVRAGDMAIGNQEGPALDLKTLTRGPHGVGGLISQPDMPADYKAMGFDMMSVANNHSTDWGGEGLLRAMELLDRAGVAHAGGGRNLAEAVAGGFAETPKGRVGLVATASTFKPDARAADPFGVLPERAGISTLRTRAVRLITAGQMAHLKQFATDVASPLRPPPPADAKQVTFSEELYRLADKPGLTYDMDLYDHTALLKAVREAKARSDLVVFHIHAHESPTGVDDDTPEPPDFLVKLFHDTIDAGADMVMGGGPHSMRGVEIYKGKPIFYGLGLFFFKPQLMGTPDNMLRKMPETGYPPPPDPRPNNPASWYDSVVAVSDFDGPTLKQVRLYPIDLANTNPPGSRGLPHLATGAQAQEILGRLTRDSAPFGTTIRIENGVGVIRVR